MLQTQKIKEMESYMERFWKKLNLQPLQGVKTSVSLLISYKASSKNVSARVSKQPWQKKTANGIKRFQENQRLGEWFTAFFEVVRTRESCQPDLALEPSPSPSPSGVLGDLWMIVARKKNYLFPWKQKEGSHLNRNLIRQQ